MTTHKWKDHVFNFAKSGDFDIVYTREQAASDIGFDVAELERRTAKWMGLVQDFDPEWLGICPAFLDEDDPRPAREQFNERYIGGWNPSWNKATLDGELVMHYPGDPPMTPLAMLGFREEIVLLYDHQFFAIVQPDGSYEISRMD